MSTIAHEVLFECKAIKCWVLKKKHFAHQKKICIQMYLLRPPMPSAFHQHYVIKFVSDLRQVGGFLRVFRLPPPIIFTNVLSHTRKAFIPNVILPKNIYSECNAFVTYYSECSTFQM
jgi:hypothetical protein